MSATTDDALYTITAPNSTMSTTVVKRIQSVLSFCAILLYFVHQIFENSPAVFVALKLIETRARRGQQHRIAGLRGRPSLRYRALQRTRVNQRRRTFEL